MNILASIRIDTDGFGAPKGVDPHVFEVHIPAGSSGKIRIVEHYGIAAGAFGRESVERCELGRKTWGAIRDDLKRHLNERLKEKDLKPGAWKTGVNRLERLLGQELLLLAWAVEEAKAEVMPVAIRNWLALRPEERWWLYAATASATGETKHSGVGWRKALRFALTENPVREALSRSRPATDAPLKAKGGKSRPKSIDANAPLFPGFEEDASPFLMDATFSEGDQEDTDAGTLLPEEHSVVDRGGTTDSKDFIRVGKRERRRPGADADSTGLILEGTKAARSGQGVRSRGAATGKRKR